MRFLVAAVLLLTATARAQFAGFNDLAYMSQGGQSLLTSLIAAWHFDEHVTVNSAQNRTDAVAGLVWYDKGTMHSASERGQIGGALSFSNSVGSCKMSLTNALFDAGSGKSFTMALWQANGTGHLGEDNGTTTDYYFAPGVPNAWFCYDLASVPHTLNFYGTPSWYNNVTPMDFIVVGYDDSVHQMFASVNGGTKATLACTGVRATGGLPFVNMLSTGLTDELYFWSRALSQAEINKLWNNSDGLAYPFNRTAADQWASSYGWAVTNLGSTIGANTYMNVSNLVSGLIADNVWTNFNFVMPVPNESLKAAMTSIKTIWMIANDNSAIWSMMDPTVVNHNFVDADVSSTGLTGDGSSKWFYIDNSIYNTGTYVTNIGNAGFVINLPTDYPGGTEVGMEDYFGAPQQDIMFHVNNPWEQTTGKTFAWLGDTNSVVVSNTPAPGFYSIQRENSNSFKMYFANAGNAHSLIASDTTTTRTTFVRPQHIFLFCYYDGNICGGCNFSSNTINFFANEWNYLSSAQSAAVYARVKAYRDIVAAQLFTLQPTNSTVLFGNNKTLAATYGYGSPTYQWQKNGVNIGGATQSSYTVTGAALSDFGNYKCIADDGGVFVNSASIQLATVTTTTTSNWLQTCYINKSVLVSSNSIWGVDQFWNGLVTDGLDSNMIILNPIVPDSLLAALTPLIAGPGSTLWVNHSFTDGDVTVNGITGNGSKYINTGASPSATYSPVTSAGQVIYLYNGPGSIASADFGSWASSSFGMMIFAHYNDGKTYDYNGTIAGNAIIINPSPGNGFYSDQRISATDHRLFFANSGTSHTQEGSTDVNSWTSAQSSFSMLFMAESDGGGPESPSNNTDSFVAATKGLNSTQSSNLYNRVQTLRTVLGGGYR